MLRESDQTDSKFVNCFANRMEDTVVMGWRTGNDQENPFYAYGLSLQGFWLKLTRTSNTYQCSYKINASDDWNDMTPTKIFAMTTQLNAGVFLSTNNAPAETITFRDFSTGCFGCQDTVKIVENGVQTSDTRLRNSNLVTLSDTAGAYLSVPGRATPTTADNWNIENLPIDANNDFVLLAKMKVDGSGSGASLIINDLDMFCFDNATPNNISGGDSNSEFFLGFVEANYGTHNDNLFYFKVERKLGTIKFYINGHEVASTANYNDAVSKFMWRPWRADLKIYDLSVSGSSLLNF